MIYRNNCIFFVKFLIFSHKSLHSFGCNELVGSFKIIKISFNLPKRSLVIRSLCNSSPLRDGIDLLKFKCPNPKFILFCINFLKFFKDNSYLKIFKANISLQSLLKSNNKKSFKKNPSSKDKFNNFLSNLAPLQKLQGIFFINFSYPLISFNSVKIPR